MLPVRPHPPEADWEEATRLEVDSGDRVRGLRFVRRVGTLGTALVGLVLLGVSLLVLRGSGALPPLLYFGFVGGLLALSPGIWLALTLTIRRVPDRIAFDQDRVMVHFLSGRVREIPWNDPLLALDLMNLGESDFTGGTILLTSRMKHSGSMDAAITVEGASALQNEALRQGLHVESKKEEAAAKMWGVVEIRRVASPDARSLAPTPKPGEKEISATPGLADGGFEYGQ